MVSAKSAAVLLFLVTISQGDEMSKPAPLPVPYFEAVTPDDIVAQDSFRGDANTAVDTHNNKLAMSAVHAAAVPATKPKPAPVPAAPVPVVSPFDEANVVSHAEEADAWGSVKNAQDAEFMKLENLQKSELGKVMSTISKIKKNLPHFTKQQTEKAKQEAKREMRSFRQGRLAYAATASNAAKRDIEMFRQGEKLLRAMHKRSKADDAFDAEEEKHKDGLPKPHVEGRATAVAKRMQGDERQEKTAAKQRADFRKMQKHLDNTVKHLGVEAVKTTPTEAEIQVSDSAFDKKSEKPVSKSKAMKTTLHKAHQHAALQVSKSAGKAAAKVQTLKTTAKAPTLKTTAKVPTLKATAKVPTPKAAAKVPTPKAAAKPSTSEATAKVSTPKAAVKVPTVKAVAKRSFKAEQLHIEDRASELALQVSRMKLTVERAEKKSARVEAAGIRLNQEIAQKKSHLN